MCDPISQRGNELQAGFQAFTLQAYSDGVITDEEYAKSDAYYKAIGQTTADLLLCVQTGVLPPGYAPVTSPDPAALQAACAAFDSYLGKYGRLLQRDNDAVPVIEYIERFTERTGWVTGGVERVAPPPLKPAFKVIGALYESENKLANYVQFLHEQDHKSRVTYLGHLNASYSETCKGVSPAARSSFAAFPVPTPVGDLNDARAASLPGTPASAAKPTSLGRLLLYAPPDRRERAYDLPEARGRDEHAPQPPHR